MTEPPDFLTVGDVLLLHEQQLARYGGGAGLRGVTVKDPEGRLYEAMMALAEHRSDKSGFASLLRELAGTSG